MPTKGSRTERPSIGSMERRMRSSIGDLRRRRSRGRGCRCLSRGLGIRGLMVNMASSQLRCCLSVWRLASLLRVQAVTRRGQAMRNEASVAFGER